MVWDYKWYDNITYHRMLRIINGMIIVIVSKSITLYMIGLGLFNLSVYSYISKQNFRSIFSYIILSSIGYLISISGLSISYSLILLGSYLKSSIHPFTSWGIPIYRALTVKQFIIVLVLTKLVHLYILSSIVFSTKIWFLLLFSLVTAGIVSINITDFVGFMVLSGSIQIVFILFPLISNNNLVFYLSLGTYLISMIVVYNLFTNRIRGDLSRALLYPVLFILIGLPPFIGFYTKFFILLDLSSTGSNLDLLLFLLLVVLSSYITANLYLKSANPITSYTLDGNSNYKMINITLYLSAILLLVSPIFYSDLSTIFIS